MTADEEEAESSSTMPVFADGTTESILYSLIDDEDRGFDGSDTLTDELQNDCNLPRAKRASSKVLHFSSEKGNADGLGTG